MEFNLQWGSALPLAKSGDDFYGVDWEQIPKSPGVYVFFRAFGTSSEALYVGKAENLRSRIKGQFNSHKLMKGIENASIGYRYVVFGEFKQKPGQRTRLLQTIERALIRHYLAKGDGLLNVQGTRVRKHSLASTRHTKILHRLIPKDLYFEYR
jgi:hypothetical protein